MCEVNQLLGMTWLLSNFNASQCSIFVAILNRVCTFASCVGSSGVIKIKLEKRLIYLKFGSYTNT